MKLYISHSSAFDFKSKLYRPLRESALNIAHDIILPHEKQILPDNTKEVIESCDVVVAEVSLPSTGQGIELGWADSAGVRILGFFTVDSKPSSSISIVADELFEYSNSDDLMLKLSLLI